jgi:hypothetical protein
MVKLSLAARSLLATLTVVAAPSLAHAQSKSATVGIDVVIPPFAAGMAATAEGAVGMNTFDTGGGLLVKSSDMVAPNAQGSVSVFSLASTHVTARIVAPGPGAAPTIMASLVERSSTDFRGMNRADFAVVPNGTAMCARGLGPSAVSVLVSAL